MKLFVVFLPGNGWMSIAGSWVESNEVQTTLFGMTVSGPAPLLQSDRDSSQEEHEQQKSQILKAAAMIKKAVEAEAWAVDISNISI